MDTNDALRMLGLADIRITGTGPDYVVTDDGERITVIECKTAPTPSQAEKHLKRLSDDDRILFIVQKMTPSLRRLADADERVIVADSGNDSLWANRRSYRADGAKPWPPRGQPRGRRPYVAFAVARTLSFTGDRTSQNRLARLLHVTQPAVSQAIARLGNAVDHANDGWAATDRRALFDYAATDYPGPEGITTYWWDRDDVASQAERVAAAAPETLAGGDIAARAIHGWRVSEHATMYVPHAIDMTALRFAAATADDYTTSITVPKDRTLWATAAAWSTKSITDPVITYRDVVHTGTTGDQDEAAAQVRATALKRGAAAPI